MQCQVCSSNMHKRSSKLHSQQMTHAAYSSATTADETFAGKTNLAQHVTQDDSTMEDDV